MEAAPDYQASNPVPSSEPAANGRRAEARCRRVFAWALAIATVTICLYLPSWRFPLLHWDDDENVLANPVVVTGGWAGVREIFTQPFSTDYYPLAYLSLAADHWWGDGRLAAYHVTQTLLHAFNAVLVVLLAWRLTGLTGVAVVAGAWFAFHPLQVESVAWLAERKNVLGTALTLLAFLAYLRGRPAASAVRADGPAAPPDLGRPGLSGRVGPPRPTDDGSGSAAWGWRLAALLLFVLAVLSHALVIVLPVLLLAYELGLARARWRQALARTWLFFVPAALAALLRVLGHQESRQLVRPFHSLGEGVRTMAGVIGQYLTAIVWPAGLSNHYTVSPVRALADPVLLLPLAWLGLWLALLALSSRCRPAGHGGQAAALPLCRSAALPLGRSAALPLWLCFGALWFLICLLPVLQLVPHPTLRADRYLYLAMIGPLVAIALGLGARPRLLAGLGAAGALALAGLTVGRLPDWRDARALWADCAAKNPRDVVAPFSLAGVEIRERNWAAAEPHLRRALELRPDFAAAHARLGGVLAMLGRRDEAVAHLRRALELDPGDVEARRNLAALTE